MSHIIQSSNTRQSRPRSPCRSRSRSTSPSRRMEPPVIVMHPYPLMKISPPISVTPPNLHSVPSPESLMDVDSSDIKLNSIRDGKITAVSVYSSRAEITRLFTVKVNSGLSRLLVRGLPRVLDQDSLRVEGRGQATIHDVAVGYLQPPRAPTTQVSSVTIDELCLQKDRAQLDLDRTREARKAYTTYLSTVSSVHLDTKAIVDVVESYRVATAAVDKDTMDLEARIKDIERQLKIERAKLKAEPAEMYDDRLCMKASISVYAHVEGDIEIVLSYAVSNASWKPGYDIRVDTQNQEKPIQMTYKGAINQNTGEDWRNVSLTLETANPTYGLSVPTLNKWALSVKKPPPAARPPTAMSGLPTMPIIHMTHGMPMSGVPMSGGMPMAPMMHSTVEVNSKGTVSATFEVPGVISIPSDSNTHNVDVTALFLESSMSWICVPKKDNKIHLKAKIKNASEYTLLPGSGNVYLDGSFISKTNIPLVSPEETFECPLGLDPSIRVTYHPLSKKVSKSGFYTKTTNHVYEQRITIFNTKPHNVDGFKLLDQFPVSEDSEITVKYVSPALVLPSTDSTSAGSKVSLTSSTNTLNTKGIAPVRVSKGVVAQWDGAGEVESGDVSINSLGKDGKFVWICSLPAGAKVGLVLSWEVLAPVKIEIIGMERET